MCATCRRRAVGSRSPSSASATSWPWAHVSISRAVANERAPMVGPYHGMRALGSIARSAVEQRGPTLAPRRQELRRRDLTPGCDRGIVARVDVASSALALAWKASTSTTARRRRAVEEPQVADLVLDHPALGRRRAIPCLVGQVATRTSSASCSASRSSQIGSIEPSCQTRTRRRGARGLPVAPRRRRRSLLLDGLLGRSRRRLAGARLAGAFLAAAFLAGAFLAGARLAGAFFAAAFLAGAFFAGARLARAFLAAAFLAGAFFAGARLAGAFFTAAFLAGAAFLVVAFLAGAALLAVRLLGGGHGAPSSSGVR